MVTRRSEKLAQDKCMGHDFGITLASVSNAQSYDSIRSG
jgi:hypothetical protein